MLKGLLVEVNKPQLVCLETLCKGRRYGDAYMGEIHDYILHSLAWMEAFCCECRQYRHAPLCSIGCQVAIGEAQDLL